MALCDDVKRWITNNVTDPIETFFQRAHQDCADARKWVEDHISTPIETVESRVEQQCREQECNWWCLCCNKWFCWLVTIVLKFIDWIVKVVGQWLIETICNLVVELVHVIVRIVTGVLGWIVETAACLPQSLCGLLYLLGGIALVVVLVGLALAAAGAPLAAPVVAGAAVAAAACLTMAFALCDRSACRLLGVVLWSFKWSIVLAAAVAVLLLAAGAAFLVALYGGTASLLTLILLARNCPLPRLFVAP